MADYNYAVGAGIGSGISSFADAYMKAKQMQQTNDLNQQYVNIAKTRENAGLLGQGMEATPEGGVHFTPEQAEIHKAKQTNDLLSALKQQRSNYADSPESKQKRNFMKMTLNEVSPGYGDQAITEDMSAADLAEHEPMVGHLLNGLSGVARARIMADSKYDTTVQQMAGKQAQQEHENQILQQKLDAQEKAYGAKYDQMDKANQDKFAQQEKMFGLSAAEKKELEDMRNASKEKIAAGNNQTSKENVQSKITAKVTGGKNPNKAFDDLNKNFAKDWNSYTSGGRATLDQSLDRLNSAKEYLENNPDATGSYKGLIPQGIRSITNPEVVAQKQAVQQAAMQGMKAVFGGRITQYEVQQFVNGIWDDKLPAKDNIGKINSAMERLNTERENVEKKGSKFEKTGTLEGMQQSQPTGFLSKKQKGSGLVQPQQQPIQKSPPPPNMSFEEFKKWKAGQ